MRQSASTQLELAMSTIQNFSLCFDFDETFPLSELRRHLEGLYGTIGYAVIIDDQAGASKLLVFQEYEGVHDVRRVVAEFQKQHELRPSRGDCLMGTMTDADWHPFMCKGSGPNYETEGPIVVYNNEPYVFEDEFFEYNHHLNWKPME